MLEATGPRTFAARRARLIVPIVLMLLFVLGQSTFRTGGLHSLAHALDHEKMGVLAFGEHHGHVLDGNGVPDPDPVGETEHNLLHQIEHGQLVPLSVPPQRVLAGMAVMVASPFFHIGQRRNERMFRPPRLS